MIKQPATPEAGSLAAPANGTFRAVGTTMIEKRTASFASHMVML